MRHNRRLGAALCIAAGLACSWAAARAQEASSPSASARAAAELAAALKAGKLDAIAARDSDQPDRFFAALHYPAAQLLAVSAQYPAPQLLAERLYNRQYREIYMDLQSAALREGRIFVMDSGADGLQLRPRDSGSVDIVYENGVQRVAYNGDWRAQKMSESEYNALFEADDARYARMLEALTREAQGAGAATPKP